MKLIYISISLLLIICINSVYCSKENGLGSLPFANPRNVTLAAQYSCDGPVVTGITLSAPPFPFIAPCNGFLQQYFPALIYTFTIGKDRKTKKETYTFANVPITHVFADGNYAFKMRGRMTGQTCNGAIVEVIAIQLKEDTGICTINGVTKNSGPTVFKIQGKKENPCNTFCFGEQTTKWNPKLM